MRDRKPVFEITNQIIGIVRQPNPGNHFAHGIERTAAGIQWLLDR